MSPPYQLWYFDVSLPLPGGATAIRENNLPDPPGFVRPAATNAGHRKYFTVFGDATVAQAQAIGDSVWLREFVDERAAMPTASKGAYQRALFAHREALRTLGYQCTESLYVPDP